MAVFILLRHNRKFFLENQRLCYNMNTAIGQLPVFITLYLLLKVLIEFQFFFCSNLHDGFRIIGTIVKRDFSIVYSLPFYFISC